MRPWLIGATGIGILLAALSIDTESTRTRRIGQFTLVERVHVTRQPYTHIAESGGDAYLPIPRRRESVRFQALVVDDDTVWMSRRDHWVEPTPRGWEVVVGSRAYDQPWRIVHMDGRIVEVPGPRADELLPGEGHEYPFESPKWVNTGLGRELLLMAYTHGSRDVDYFPRHRVTDTVVTRTTYVRAWTIDPRTGAHQRMAHCEVPYTTKPNWDGYSGACGQAPPHR